MHIKATKRIPNMKISAACHSKRKVASAEDVSEEYEDEIKEIGQEFTSENTSINSSKLPAIFKMVSFEPGTVNIDYGGGRFDNVADYLTQFDVINLVYDPYNRTPEHNKEVIRTVKKHGGADTATCSNVLNVIKEPEVRKNVLENIKKLVKPTGIVYITVYEGTGKGDEGATKSGYQLNRKTADYLEEIQEVFPDATRKGKLIVAHPSGAVQSSTSIEASAMIDEDLEDFGNRIVDSLGDQYDMNFELVSIYADDNSINIEIESEDGVSFEAFTVVDDIEGLDESNVDDYWPNVMSDLIDSIDEYYESDVEACQVTSASYGGAFDIADDQFFTREDLEDLAQSVLDKVSDEFPHDFEISDMDINNNVVSITLTDLDSQSEFRADAKIDMRKIRKGSDILKYADTIANKIFADVSNYEGIDYFGVNASEDMMNENDVYQDIAESLEKEAKASMILRHGFPEDEVDDYLFVEVGPASRKGYIQAEVRAELSYNYLLELAQKLDNIIQQYDEDAYFDVEQPGIIIAWIRNNIEASTSISSAKDIPEPSLDPPESKEPEYLDGQESVDIDIDADIEVDDNGVVEFVTDIDDALEGIFAESVNTTIRDYDSVLEDIDSLLADADVPEAGKYHIKGTAHLIYDIEGAEFIEGDDSFADEVDTSRMKVSLSQDSRIDDLSIE